MSSTSSPSAPTIDWLCCNGLGKPDPAPGTSCDDIRLGSAEPGPGPGLSDATGPEPTPPTLPGLLVGGSGRSAVAGPPQLGWFAVGTEPG